MAYNSVDLGGNSGWNFATLPPLSNPGVINGPASFCPGATGVTYYIAPVPGAISYTWTVPLGATITSGQGDTLITVNLGTAVSGNISVNAFSGCALSAASNFAVTANLGSLAAVSGGSQSTVRPVPAHHHHVVLHRLARAELGQDLFLLHGGSR